MGKCDAFTNSDFAVFNSLWAGCVNMCKCGPIEIVIMYGYAASQHSATPSRFDLKATVNERIDDDEEDGDRASVSKINLSNEFYVYV